MKTNPRPLLRGFPPRRDDPPRDAAHRHDGRRRALHRALRLALRGAVLRRLRAGDRLSAQSPLDDWLVFHVVFGKTVPDISLNAVANLGYADGRFLKPVYPGETLSAVSEVIGLKESSNRQTGIVYVRSTGFDAARRAGADLLPLGAGAQARPGGAGAGRARAGPAEGGRACGARRRPARRSMPPPTTSRSPAARTASATTPSARRIDHVDGMTVEEAEHQLATRLYQNTAKVHFDAHAAQGQPLRPAPDLWRPRHLARPRALLQRPRQRLPRRRDQRRPPRRAALCRRHGLCLERGPGQGRAARPHATSARCACAPSRPRTSPAPPSRTGPARTTTRP